MGMVDQTWSIMMRPTYYPVEKHFDDNGVCYKCGKDGIEIPGLGLSCHASCAQETLSEIMIRTDDFEPNRLTKAFEKFSDEVYEKMMEGYNAGKTGWDDPEWIEANITDELHKHIVKGDPRDVAVLAMFWWNHLQKT